MGKSAVTDYFLKYFEENRIDLKEISEKTGIRKQKLSKDYKVPLTAEEFLKLCIVLKIQPEEIQKSILNKKAGSDTD